MGVAVPADRLLVAGTAWTSLDGGQLLAAYDRAGAFLWSQEDMPGSLTRWADVQPIGRDGVVLIGEAPGHGHDSRLMLRRIGPDGQVQWTYQSELGVDLNATSVAVGPGDERPSLLDSTRSRPGRPGSVSRPSSPAPGRAGSPRASWQPSDPGPIGRAFGRETREPHGPARATSSAMTEPLPRTSHHLLVIVLAALGACVPAKLDLFTSDGAIDSGSASAPSSSAGTDGASTGDGSTASAGTTDDLTTAGTAGDEPPMCGEPITNCKWDDDRDGVADNCDNAPHMFNPDQADFDGDGFGDVWDKCPTVPSDSNVADSDKDGVGNDCDLCARSPGSYNGDLAIPAYMKVRNIPGVGDSDHDGIGDACDNCVRTPNCQGYGDGLDPYEIGDPIDDEAPDCQTDADADLVGDACAGAMMPGAAGPVGFAPTDDFDQDGLANQLDTCPRLPVVFQACDGPEDCPDSGVCTAGVCGHQDSDQDGVGDICDSCPWSANPKQIQDGGAEEDDPDGDFVGNACETTPVCYERPDPRPFGFYDGSVNGYCCVQLGAAGTALDPDGDIVPLSPKVLATPGVGALPPGCAQEALPIDPADVGEAVWSSFCLLPQLDQDLDGVAYNCDLCPHAYDPGQEPYVDENDVEFPDYGKYCNGDYAPENLDPAMMCLPGT